jgi:hypothetical protein
MATKTMESKSAADLKNLASKINPEHKEGEIAKAIEKQTAKLPSDLFLWAGLSILGGSLALKLFKKDHLSLFIGQLASPFLLFGIYDKLVKLQGHDKTDKGQDRTTGRGKSASKGKQFANA